MIALLPVYVLALPGELDPSFGTGGIATTAFSPHGPVAGNDILVQPDGKIVVASGALADFLQGGWNIARYNVDGTPDSSFATGGKMTFFLNGGPTHCNSIAIQSDGKIIMAGTRGFLTGPPDQWIANLKVARLTTNGAVEASFEIPLMLNVGFVINDVAVQSDGKILVAGILGSVGYVIRLTSGGALDTTFEGDGIANYSAAAVNAISVQSDGKVLAAGQSGSDWAVWRFNSNGTPDTSFDGDGIYTGPAGTSGVSTVREMVIRPNGKILTVGDATVGVAGTALVQLNTNGTLDTSFSGDGKVFTAIAQTVRGLDVEIQPDGRAVAFSGSATSTNGSNGGTTFGLSRYLSNGNLDTSFSADGIQSLSVVANPSSIALQPNGNIVASGSSMNGGFGSSFGVARFYGTGAKPFDFDGDSRTDLSIFRPGNGQWWYQRSSNGTTAAAQFGTATDRLVPGDYTGDGKVDVAIWRPTTGDWFVLRSENNTYFGFTFGTNGDLPTPADYDGDGVADAAVFRPTSATWYISPSTGGTTIQNFGTSTDKPVVADYDGDSMADIAIWRPSAGEWWVRRSSNATTFAVQFGNSGDKPVQCDFTGDGKADIAFWRPSTGNWFVLRSEDFSYFAFTFGANGDVPTPGDYDGDGRFDAGVFRPTNATWFVNRSTGGTMIQQFGVTTDTPLPSAFVP